MRAWAVPLTIFLVCWSLTTHGKYSDSGDEPHYLMVTQSLIADRDLDLRNNYAADDGRRFGADGLQMGLHAQETRTGQLFPVHDIALPVLIVPAYLMGRTIAAMIPDSTLRRFRMGSGLFTYSIVSLFMIALTCAAAALTRSALLRAGVPAGPAAAIVLAAWLSPPLLSNAFLVFPEMVALLVTAWAVMLAVTRASRLSPASLVGFAAALGALPWFHRKFAIYGACLLVALVATRRDQVRAVPRRVKLGALAAFAIPQLLLVIWTWHYWGNLGGPIALGGAPFSWHALGSGWLGMLVDRENGLFVWAPVYLLLPAAWALAPAARRIWLLPVLALFLMSAAHDQWWGGFSPAGRFLVPLVPIFALIAGDVHRVRPLRTIAVILLIPQAMIAAYGWQHPRALWPQGDGRNQAIEALFGWAAHPTAWLPSLRTVTGVPETAGVLLATILIANAVLAVTIRRAGERALPPPRR